MHVSEVHFNHDPLTHSGDAMTIRQNYEIGRIVAPEWRRGVPTLAAAYAAGALVSTVSIKVRFGGGPPGGSARIRAVDADTFPRPRGCAGLIVYLILLLAKALKGNVLGDVAEKTITFDEAGNSGLETMTLSGHRLKTSGVSDRTTRWNWESREEAGWTRFDQTQHRIFVVLDTPRAPWSQQLLPEVVEAAVTDLPDVFIDNTQLPWVDALEVACRWALGATTKHAAASEITRAVNSETPQVYNTITHFGGSSFLLTWYLSDLKAGLPFQTNCTDCANAVTALSNLLGCDLVAQYFSTPFEETKPFLELNGNPADLSDWVTYLWTYHEFGWMGQPNPSGHVYDACLQVDVDDDPEDDVHIAQHPLRMPFGSYKPRLWDGDGGLGEQSRRPVR